MTGGSGSGSGPSPSSLPPPPPHNLNANQLPSEANIALYEAAQAATDVGKLQTLLTHTKANPNWYNNQEGGQTALHAVAHAPASSATDILKLLLAHGAVTQVVTLPDFNLPLHFAAAAGNVATVELLVAHEGDAGIGSIRKGNLYGNSPLHEACMQGHEEVVRFLLGQDAQRRNSGECALVNVPNKRGSTPLLFSLYGSHASVSLVALLLEHGADATHVDHDGVGVLHICAMQGHTALVSFFLSKQLVGSKGLAADANGHTPLFYARMKDFECIVQLLLAAEQQHIEEEEKDKDGNRGEL